MALSYRKRVPLVRTKSAEAWLNLSLGLPSLSVRVGRVVFNTRRGFSSVRIGQGLSWRDRD